MPLDMGWIRGVTKSGVPYWDLYYQGDDDVDDDDEDEDVDVGVDVVACTEKANKPTSNTSTLS